MDNSNPFGFTNYNTSDFSFENNLQDIASNFNASDSPYARKLADVGLGFREKMILAKQANLGKLAAMEGYRTGYILGADDERAGVDPDSGLVQDEATGDIFRFRMRQAGNYDAVDNADVVAKSRYKQGYQPEYVAAMNGKRVEELTDFDYKNVKNYQTQETFAAWQDPDHQTIPYDPNFVYSAPSADQRIPVLYKSTGSGFYGRDLTDMINPKTGRSMTFDAAMNPYLNASFQLGDYLDIDANRRRIDEFNALPAQPMKDRVAQKRVDNIFNQPSNGRYPRTFESKKMSMDEIIDRYQADRNDFMEFVDQLGYNVDKAQASLKQTIGHLARALLPSSWIDENYWKSLDKPVNEQGMTLADVISGVDPIQYAIHQRHNKENDAVWDKAKGEYEKGNYSMAAVNALNYLRKSIVDVNYLLADSFGQMAASSGGTAAGGAVGGVIGGMVGGPAGAKVGAHIGAFLTGTMITAFDETVMARDQYKEQNNGQDMSPERVLATFGAHMLAAAPEQVLQMIGLKKVLPNGIANAIFKDGEKIASRASASIPELMSAKGALEAGKQVGKAFLGAGLAEAGQEGFQNFVTAYASQNQENPKSAWEVAIDDDQLKAALAGFAMGGVMHGAATGIGLSKSLKTEKANALAQEQFEEERQTKTIGGGTANTEQSNKLINDVQNIDLSASSSSADTLKVRDDLKKQQENLFINGAAEEALFKKISEAEVKSVTQMRREGKSEEQITKALNGKTKEEVFTDIVLSSNYNSNWAITHNTDPTKVNRKDLTNELLSIAKDLGLTEEQARKTMKDVSSDVRYGPAGYLSYMAKARKGLEELKKSNLTDDEKKNLRNVTGNTILRLIHLLANQQNKLAAFAEGLEKIDAGDATDYTIKYPLSEGEFKIYGNYVLRDDPSSNKGVYGVINDIYDTVDEMTTFFKSEPNLSKDTSTALFAMYRNGQGSLPIDLNINENLRKRIYNAVDRIKARGPEDLKPVKPVTKENTSTYLRALGDVVRNLQNNRVDSDSHIKRLRTLDKLLRQDNNAYDALKTAIEKHPKYTDQQKTDYIAQLNAIKSSIDRNRKNMSVMKADYTSTVAEAEKALNELNDDFINQHVFSKDGDYHSLGTANVPLTEARTRISNILQNIRATSGNTEMDRDLVNKLSTTVNKIQKRISDNIDTYNNRKKPAEATASKPTVKSKFDREDLIPYNSKSLSRTDIAEVKKQASFGEISQYRSRMANLLNDKLKSLNNTPSDKIPESTKRYVNSLRAKIDLLDQLAAILTKNRRQRLTSKIDTAKYRKLITSDVDHILKYESNDDKQAFDMFANLEKLKASAEAKLEKAKKSQAKDAKQAIQTAEARLELIEKRIKELEALPQMRRVEVDANGVVVNDVKYGEYTFLKSDFNEAHKELDKILDSYKLDATGAKASTASTKTFSQAKPSKGQTKIVGQMSDSAKKAFNALFNAGKIDKLKDWEAYYVREKDKYKPGTQEYADVMQTKAYITKLINESTKPQKSSKPAEKPAETASSETAQETPEKAPESPQTKGNGQDDKLQGEAQQTPPTASERPSKGSQETFEQSKEVEQFLQKFDRTRTPEERVHDLQFAIDNAKEHFNILKSVFTKEYSFNEFVQNWYKKADKLVANDNLRNLLNGFGFAYYEKVVNSEYYDKLTGKEKELAKQLKELAEKLMPDTQAYKNDKDTAEILNILISKNPKEMLTAVGKRLRKAIDDNIDVNKWITLGKNFYQYLLNTNLVNTHAKALNRLKELLNLQSQDTSNESKSSSKPILFSSKNKDYNFLSNFYPVEISYKGHKYPSVEHAFQAAKTDNENEKKQFYMKEEGGAGLTALEAKRAGKKISLRKDWESVKLDVLSTLLSLKFFPAVNKNKASELFEKLDSNLLYEATGYDEFYGVNPKTLEGTNALGELLMRKAEAIYDKPIPEEYGPLRSGTEFDENMIKKTLGSNRAKKLIADIRAGKGKTINKVTGESYNDIFNAKIQVLGQAIRKAKTPSSISEETLTLLKDAVNLARDLNKNVYNGSEILNSAINGIVRYVSRIPGVSENDFKASQPDTQISPENAPRIDQNAQGVQTPTETQEVPQKGAESSEKASSEVPWRTDEESASRPYANYGSTQEKPSSSEDDSEALRRMESGESFADMAAEEALEAEEAAYVASQKNKKASLTAEIPETLLSGEPNPDHPKYKNNLKLYRQDLKKWSSAQMEERPAEEADIAVDEGTPVGEPDFLDNTESEPEPITDTFKESENFEEPVVKPRTVKKYVNGKLVESKLEDKKPTSKPRKAVPLTLNVSDEVNNEISEVMQKEGFLPSDKSLNEFLDSLTEEQKADALKFKTERATQHREHSATKTFAENSFELDTILYALYNINTDFNLPDLTAAYKFVHNFAINEFKKDPNNFSKATLTDKTYLSTLGDYATAEQFKDSAADKTKPLETVFLLKGEKEVKDAKGNTVTVKVNESAELINNVPGNTRGERQKYKEQSGDVGAIVTDKGKKLTWLNQQVVATDRADSWIPKLLNDYLPHMEATRAWYEAVKPVDEKASQWLNPTHGREVKDDENLADKVIQLRSRLDNSPHARLLYNMTLLNNGETIHFEYNDVTLACVDFSIKEFIASSQLNKFMHPNTLDDNAVAAIFHLSPDNTLPGDIYALKHILVHEGIPKSLLASSIGQLIMRNLGLKANTTYGYDTVYVQMAAGLGAYAVDVLISQRFFEENTYNNIDTDGSKKVNVLKANKLNLIKPANGLSSKVNSITDQYLGFKTNNKSKVRLSNGLNRFKNTENNYSTDPVFNKPIPVDDEAPYYVRNTQEQLTISEKQRETLKKCQEQAWEIDDDIAQFIIENMNAVMQKEGLIDEQTDSTSWNDLSFEAKIGAQGVNDSIRRRLEALKTYYLMQKEFKDSGTFNGIYFKYFIGKNGRGYLDSSEFNPQVDKLLRHICLPRDARVKIKVDNTGDSLLCENFAIAQAFDALGNRNDVKNFAEYMKNLSDDALIEIRKELTARSNDSFKKWFAENHPDTISVGVESYSQCLNVIQHLLRRNKAKANNQSSFTTSLSVENDSTTSGYAIKFLNMPFTSVSSFLEKVGILNYVRKAQLEGKIVLSNNEEKDLLFTMEELKNIEGFDDIYRTSARKTADEVMGLVNGDTKALQEKFSDKIRQNIANKLARKHKISVEELNNDPKLKDELERKVLAESEYLVNVFKVMKDALPTAKNGKIDSYFRTLMKRPTMVFGYSATARTISQRVVYELMGDFIETYLQIKNRNGIENYLAEVKGVKEGDKGYEDAKKKAEAIYKTMEMIKVKDNANLDDKLKKTFVEKIKVKRGDTVIKLNTLFENLIGVTYGDITGEILEKQFASYLQVNNDMIWMSKQMFDWYKSIYNKRVNALRNAHPKGYVTYAQMKQVHEKLLEEGIVPYTTLASNNLNPDDAKLLLYGNTKEVDNFTSVQNYINVNGVNTGSTTVYADIRIPDSPGRSGAVIPIHGQDGDVVMQVLNEYRDSKYNYGMNIIHDAIVMSAFHQIPVTRRYSELMFELNKKHSIFATMLQNFDRVLNAFAKETKIPKEQILRTAIISDRGTPVSTSEQNIHADKINKNGNEHILMEGSTQAYYRGQLQEFEDDIITVGSLLENAKAWERVIFDARKAFYNEPHFGVNMGGVNGVGVIYEAKDPISQDFKSVIEQDSSYKGFKTVEDITLLKSQALTDVEARVTILDDLQNLAATTNNTLCSDEHMNHLKEFIRAANPENIQNILFELVDNGLFNTGQYIVSKNGSKTIRVALDAKSNIDSVTKLAVESYLMAPAEIYAHEITHAALDPVFAHIHDLGIERDMKTAQMIYEEASKLLTVDDLMPEAGTFNENLTNRYRQHIQNTLDYIFNNPDHKNNRGLKEFCAYFNTCEKFRNALKKKLTEKYKDEAKATRFIDKLIAIVKNFLDMFFGKDNFTKMFNKAYRTANGVDKAKVQNLFDQMDLLLHKWSQANEKASQRLLEHPKRGIENMFRFFSQMIQKYNAPLGEWLRKHTIELADTKGWFNIHPKLMKLGATSWDKFKLYSLVAACYPISARHRAAWRRLMNGVFKVSQDSLIRSIARDMTKPDYNSSLLEMLALRTNIVDTAAKNIESVTRDQLKEDFGRELKEKEEYSLTQCILRTDAQCLNDIDYFLHLNADNEYLQTEIENVKIQLKDFYPKNYTYNWVCGQALGLARFMVTGKGHEQLNTNAYGIATGLYYTTEVTENADIQYDPKAEQLIDKLTTLYAIEHTSQEDKDVLNTLPRKGLESFINTHKKFVEESKYGVVLDDENTDNKTRIIDPIHVIKGYTKSLINSDYETEINLIDPQTQREMAKQGYKLIYTINPDNVTQRAMSLGFYKRFGIPKRRDGGAVSLQGYHAIGTTLESMSYADISPNEANYKVLRDKLHTLWKDNADKISKVINKRLKSSPMTFEEFDRFSTNFSPIASTSPKGDAIADYRITMSHDHKRQALGMDERGITILSKMYASINRKAQSSIANNEVLNFLINDMQENMNVLDRYDKKGRGYKYILLDELTDDQYLKDAWRVLPKEIRDYTKKHTLYVREDWLPSLFGVSNMSLNDTRLIRKIPFGFVKRAIAIGEMIMKTIAYYRKQSIVLKIPAVLIGNIISNLMYSIANHQNPLKVLKLTIANGKAIREYLDTKKELNRIIMKQRLGTATTTELVSKNMLKSKLEANRVHPLMEKGMYQAIVEDMNPEELESTSKLTKLLKYNKLIEKVPGSIKSVINHIYLGRGTPIYEFMYTATQYSDFIARCTEYQLRMEKSKSEYERIQKAPVTKENEAFKRMNYDQFLKNYEKITSIRVLNAFINYDKPQSKFEQYLNDMGLLFFTKFAKRIQHVITDQLWTNPIGALMFIIGQHLFVDTEDIFEQNLFSKKWSALVNTPWENFIGAAIPMPIQFLTGQQKAF